MCLTLGESVPGFPRDYYNKEKHLIYKFSRLPHKDCGDTLLLRFIAAIELHGFACNIRFYHRIYTVSAIFIISLELEDGINVDVLEIHSKIYVC